MDKSPQLEQSYLGDAESRLSRALRLLGATDPRYQRGEHILPVVLIGDGTLPGYGVGAGRRFLAGLVTNGTIAAISAVGVLAQQDLIITSLTASWTVGGILTLTYQGPNDAAAFAMATTGGCYVDRAASSAEVAPILFGNDSAAAITGAVIWRSDATTSGPLNEIIPAGFCMVAGSRLILRTSAVNCRLNLNIRGQAL